MSDPQSNSKEFDCPECGATVSVPPDEMRAKAWCGACERDVLTPWSVSSPSTDLPDDDGYELAQGFEQPEAKVYIPVICRVCNTRMYGTEDQVGQNIPCPDCFAENRVPPPSEEDRKKSAPENLGPELEMGEGISRPTLEQIGYSQLFEDDSEAAEQDPTEVKSRPIADKEDPQLSKWFLVSRVFTFPFYPSVIAWWLGLSAGGSLVLLMVQGVETLSSGPLAPLSVVLTVFAAIGTGFLGAMLFSCWLNVLQTSADGLDALYDSEGIHLFDRFLEATYVVVSLVYSFLPGWAIGQLLRLAGREDFLAVPISAFFLFPICLLSALEAGSAVVSISKPILRTMRHCWWVWLLFYLEVAVVLVIPHLVAEKLGARIFDDIWLGPVVLIAQAIIYFRLLGRVAWYGSERIAELDQQVEAVQENEDETSSDNTSTAKDEPFASNQRE